MKYVAIGENHLYSKAYAKGKKFVTRLAAVYVLPDLKAKKIQRATRDKQKINRIGLTVSKKIGGAVVRNRVKRIIREAYRAVDRDHSVKCGFLIVIVARAAAAEADSKEMTKDIKRALEKLSMLTQ